VKSWWRKLRGKGGKPAKPRRSARRRIYLEGADDSPPLGESNAQWVLDHVLHGPPLPVPSYGFDLVPVLAHSLRARRLRWMRRICIILLIALVSWAAPRAAVIWGGAILLSLITRWASFRGARKGRTTRLARFPRFAYLVLVLPWVLTLLPYSSISDGALALRTGLVLLPFVALMTTALVCAIDRFMTRATLGVLAREGVSSDHLPWLGLRARGRVSDIKTAQSRPELPYDPMERFVGAGRDVWGAANIDIPLKPKDPKESVRAFGEADLLRRVGNALIKLGRGKHEITDPLPGFSMTPVQGLPEAMWLQRTRDSKVELPDLRGLGRKSPSGKPDRLYLRAQCISWGGQVVVNVFIHAALEAGELRLTVRPHVMTPLYNELRGVTGALSKRGLRLLGWITMQSLLDATTGPVAAWRIAARLGEKNEVRAKEEDPVSLRDRYSTEEISDMHQSDDARRHVVLRQSCIFRTVDTFLDELGVDTAAYERQVAAVMTNIQVFGDNNAPIQNVAGNGISNVSQDEKT
jgi:hypothetical protein